MIDWLRREALAPEVEIAGRTLPVAIRRNARARRLTLRLAPDGSEVRVTLPKWCASREALAFVHARTGWLEQQLNKVPDRQPPLPGGTLLYRGEGLPIDWSERGRRTPAIEQGRLAVGGPIENLTARLKRWLEREATREFCRNAPDEAVRKLRDDYQAALRRELVDLVAKVARQVSA